MKPKAKSSTAGATQVATATDRAQGSPAKPTFTRLSAGVSRRTVASKFKNTNLGMLHQSQALKASAADKARDRSETGGGGGVSRTLAGNRVEVSGVEQSTPVTSVRSRDGEFAGRVAVRASGSFNVQTQLGVVQGIAHRFCALVQRADGYAYSPA